MDHNSSGPQPSYQWLSFAYQSLTEIPYEAILTQTQTLEVLDLSYNLLQDRLEKLSTLVLDCNCYTSHVKFPFMDTLTTLCINKNNINNLPLFVDEVKKKFPSIR
ncbi:unnamed protein product [Knipowitschia caucasica]